jgi:NAD-dependent SIR2 family protein deacetylase
MTIDEKIKFAARSVKSADALLITAGAGMGVDSGLPDFRGKEGFWNAYPAIAKLGLRFEEMADPAWFRKSPGLAWAFYGHRLNLYSDAIPHGGFQQLLELGSKKPQSYFVFTSNVDGQFQKAGFASERIVECHGSIHHFQCITPCSDALWVAGEERLAVDEQMFQAAEPLPKCGKCGGMARPNILMFNDGRWVGSRTHTQHIWFERWLNRLEKTAARLVVIELGAGAAVPTVRHASESVLRKLNSTLIRINPREDVVPAGHLGIPLGAAEAMRRIYENVLTQ